MANRNVALSRRKVLVSFVAIGSSLAAGGLLAACQSAAPPAAPAATPQVIEKVVTQVVEKQVEVTKIVEKPVEVTRVVEKQSTPIIQTTVVVAPGAAYIPHTPAPGKLRFSTWSDVFKDTLALWKDRFPTVEVAYELSPGSGYTQKLLVSLAAGTAQDLVMVFGTAFHSMARKQVFLPLTDLLKTDKVSMTGWTVSPQQWCSYPIGGTIYGLHHHTPVIDNIYYNKDQLRAAGLGANIDNAWKVSDFMKMAATLNKPPDHWGTNGLTSTRNYAGFLAGLGGTIIGDDAETKVAVDSAESQEAIRTMVQPLLDKIAPNTDQNKALGDSPFASGKFSLFNGIGTAYIMVQVYGLVKKPFDWWWADPPTPDKGKKAHGGDPHHYTIYPKSSVRDTAWEFLKWIEMDPDAETAMLQQIPVPYNPLAIMDRIKDPDIRRYNIESFSRTEYFVLDWWGAKTPDQLMQVWSAEIDNVVLGKKSIKQATADMATAMNKALADAQ
jgi:ABC-type glycerol-3-phosphate transport system substrate-binding protein